MADTETRQGFADNLLWEVSFTKPRREHLTLPIPSYNESCSRHPQTPFLLLRRWNRYLFPEGTFLTYDLNKSSEMQTCINTSKLYRTRNYAEKHCKTSCFRTAHYFGSSLHIPLLVMTFQKAFIPYCLNNIELLKLFITLTRTPKEWRSHPGVHAPRKNYDRRKSVT